MAKMLVFGAVLVGRTRTLQDSIKSPTAAADAVARVSIDGESAGEFDIAAGGCAGGRAIESCVVAVTFVPTAVGLYHATLSVKWDRTASPTLVDLSGRGNLVRR